MTSILKKTAKLGLGIALGASLAVAATADTLTVGANVGNVPWEFQDADGNIVGFEVDLATAVAEKLGRDLEIVNIPFNGLFSAVQSGRIDMAMSSITITEERLESVSFAQPYYDSDQSLTTAAEGPTSLEEMKGKVVGVDTGSTGDMWTTENSDAIGFESISRYEGLAPAMLDLAAGRIDGYISDIPALLYFVRDKPNLQVVERIETGEKYSFMFDKDAPLAAEVNTAITELKEDGTVAALHEKWFGKTPEAGTSTATVLDMP
ncbi:MAG: ABC transporter substrate-binding protein [Rhodobacteraceae bacterium]|nr:ABC transporter substrate-binding protein [Paracoccaceae bacterium]